MSITELRDLSEIKDQDKVLNTVKKHINNFRLQRSYLEGEWYKYEAYYRGKHFTTWNPYSKSLVEPPSKQGEVRIPVPIAKDIVQRTLLDITKDKPKWQVIPDTTNDDEVKRARWSNQLLSSLFEKNKLSRKIKQVVLHGLKFSVGIMEVFWNPEKGEKGDVDFRVVDPSDFYIGLNFEDPEDAPCVVKAVRKDIGYLLNSKLYEKNRAEWSREIKPDNKVTSSEWREQVLARTYGVGTENEMPTPQGSVMLYECWLKYWPQGSTKPKYRIVTVTKEQDLILRNEDTDLEQTPFFVYHTDQNPGEFYGEGWLKHLIPLNRAVDLLENKILAHHHKFIGGKYYMDSGADPSTVTNEAGQFIEINPAKRFQPMDVPPLPPTSRETVTSWHRYAQDTGAIHDASLWGMSMGSSSSARSVQNLQQGDQQAKGDLRDNLEDFLELIGEEALRLIAENYTSTRLVTFYNDHGEPQQVKYVGDSSPNPQKNQLDAVIIKPRNDVKVTVGSRLGETMQARQEAVMELFHMSLVPPEEVLKEFGYGNIADIAQRAWERAENVAKLKQEKPEQKDTRDFINTRYSDLAPEQQAAYSQQIGLPAAGDPSTVPGSVAAQLLMEHVKTGSKLDTQQHNTLLNQEAGHHQMLQDLTSQGLASVSPAIPGGAAPQADMIQQAAQQQMQPDQNNPQGE